MHKNWGSIVSNRWLVHANQLLIHTSLTATVRNLETVAFFFDRLASG
jgi:hypothetical protein